MRKNPRPMTPDYALATAVQLLRDQYPTGTYAEVWKALERLWDERESIRVEARDWAGGS